MRFAEDLIQLGLGNFYATWFENLLARVNLLISRSFISKLLISDAGIIIINVVLMKPCTFYFVK